MKIVIRANLSLLSKKVKFVKRNEMQNIEYKSTLIYRFLHVLHVFFYISLCNHHHLSRVTYYKSSIKSPGGLFIF